MNNKTHLIVLLIVFSVSCAFNSIGQPSQLDSLKTRLKEHPYADTIRVELLTEYAHVATDIDLEKAVIACDEAEQLAKKLGYQKGIADALYERAWIEIANIDYDGAIASAKEALTLYEELGNLEGESFSLNCIASGYYYQSEYSKAMEYYKKSAAIDEKRNDIKGISGSYLNIGNILADQAKYEECLTYYFKSLKLKKQVKDDYGIAICLGNIGSIYGEQGNYPKALEFFKKQQIQTDKLGNTTSTAYCHLNIGSVYVHQERFEDALRSFNEVLKLNDNAEDQRIVAIAHAEIGSLNREMKDYEAAIVQFNRALKLNIEANNQREIARNLNNIGSILLIQEKYGTALKKFEEAKKINEENELNLGLCSSLIGIAKIQFFKKQFSDALNNAERAKRLADDNQQLVLQRDVTELLSKIYTALGSYDQALESYKAFKGYSDSIFNKKKIEKIAQIEYDYKYQKDLEVFNIKEKKLTNKVKTTSEDLEKSQAQLLWGIILFLIVLFVASIVIFQLRLRNVKSISENSLLEQKLLRSQMTPHFIFNSLSVLQGMILNKEEIKANQYLSKFSRLLRITLESSREKMTTLSQELLALEHYVALQNLELDIPFNYHVQLQEGLQTDHILIPPMLMQPFIENAIEHGFPNDARSKDIQLFIQLHENKLICRIEDNGVGIEATQQVSSKKKKSLATSISKERIQLLSKELKTEGSIEIVDRKERQEQGTQVTLIIPHKVSTV